MLLDWLDRPAEALVQIQRAVELDPLSTVINENLAKLLEMQGRFHDAHAHYRRAIMIDPFGPRPYAELAYLNAYVFDRFADAVPLLQRAMELDSDSGGFNTQAIGPNSLAISATSILAMTAISFEATAKANSQFLLALVNLIQLDAVGAVRHAQTCA